ncbi:MAG: tRNA (adenosine(37)-N6)-threonylcarbamoyltransferase complex ATPase subunit type 1 TsaE [Bacillota bacterium]|nr:tRNA (adenosine(37)-N6)-threonylcarbamoyltransferase complex ATPase subunit type 1 TsaE [Bacillota bacterium]
MKEITLKNLSDTERFGKILSDIIGPGSLICLNGDLGAGKTTLTQIIGKNLNVKEYVNSPSYSLMNTYNGTYQIHHYDLYKLGGVDDALDIGVEDYIYSDDYVVIIEWANKIQEILPKKRIEITIRIANNKRILKITGDGKFYAQLIKELSKNDSFRN